ncbi:MAG: hypothetical protein BAA01_14255 [Bacillus thermozeamaize]|uniref:DUF3169 domain-containing protein n=1 Tax=Bacillus thermozeamaize TaxID=230954 RepID=A0A1Y3PWP6_9BACI|nr:MAG: hypothetical protein BAA01_14255 [Bacillus thermozeamaize]
MKKRTFLSLIAGSVSGFILAFTALYARDLSAGILIEQYFFLFPYDWLYLLIGMAVLIGIILSRSFLTQAKRDLERSGEIPEFLEKLTGKALISASLSSCGATIWLIIALAQLFTFDEPFFWLLVNVTLSLFMLLLSQWLLRQCINLFNLVYPERKFQFDMSSQEYFEKLDEAEKYIAYHSAFQAFKSMDMMLLLSLGILVVYAIFVQFALFPMLLLSALWILQKGIYFRETMKFYRAE